MVILANPLLELKNNNFQIVAADITEDALDYQQIDYTQPTALLLGAEIDGISSKQNPILTIQSLYQC